MKKYIIITVFVIKFSVLFGQDQPVVTITPEKPLRGETVTITYNPSAKGAKIKDAKEMDLIYDNYAEYYGRIKNMVRTGNKWVITLPLQDTVTAYVSFYFRSLGDYDDNNEKLFNFQVFDSKSKPVRNAFYYKSQQLIYSLVYNIYETKIRDSLLSEELKKELFYHPENIKAQERFSSINSPKSCEINVNFDLKRKEIEKNVSMTEEKKKKALESIAKSENAIKAQNLFKNVFKEADADKKKELAEKYVKEYPESFSAYSVYNDLFEYYVQKKDIDKILEYGRKWISTEKYQISAAYNRVAWVLTLNKCHFDEALKYVEKAFENMDNDIYFSSSKMTDSGIVITPSQKNRKRQLTVKKGLEVSYENTRGWIYYQMGDCEKAEPIIRMAFYDQPDNVNRANRLIELYNKVGKKDSVCAIYEKCLEYSYGDKNFEDNYKKDYMLKNNSDKGFEEVIEKIKLKNHEIRKSKAIIRKIDKDTPKFTITMDNGKVFDIEKEKGKVILLYFYESALISFKEESPVIQKVYDKYKDRKDFNLLAINTRQGNLETKTKHDRIIKECNINFPSAYDVDHKASKLYNKFFYTSVLEDFPLSMIDTSGEIQTPVVVSIDKSGKFNFGHQLSAIMKLSLMI